MRLSRLEIQNFRGISSMFVEFERDVSVLIGENNSGKTSVLDAIRFGLDSIRSTKSCVFSEFDFHRNSASVPLSQCPEIGLTFFFEESDEFPWSEDVIRLLDSVIVGSPHACIKLKIKGWFDSENQELSQDWFFLDDQGNEMPAKRDAIRDIRKIRPFFFQTAIRIAKDEFQKGAYWNSFVKNKDIDDALRKTLEDELAAVNQRIIDAHSSFNEVTEEVNRISKLLAVASQNAVTIDPSISDVYQALRSAEVNLLTGTNAKIPIRNHGEGTQSLSVLLLFSAYLKTRLVAEFDRNAEPIVTIEEPEAHLHPNAIRSLWFMLKELPGQKIIATHSGDILSEVPIRAIRRLSKTSGKCECKNIPEGALEPEELRKLNHHVRRNRGELLFARKWLIVEGETDVSVFVECADILEVNFNQLGIRVVECSQAGGPGIFIKAADALGIEWHLVADNDDGGQKYIDSAVSLLNGRDEISHISKLASPNIDVLLCRMGFGKPYRDGVTYKKISELTEEEGTDAYWDQVYAIVKNLRSFSKPAAALDAIELIRQRGALAVPAEVKSIIMKISLSQVGE